MNEFRGQRIKELRKEMHMPQSQLSEASNVSRQTISALENGKCDNVLIGTLISIANVLDTTVDSFFYHERPNVWTNPLEPPPSLR